MATHANSTPEPERTSLRETAAPGRLLPDLFQSPFRQAELPAIISPRPLRDRMAKHQAELAAVEAEIEAMFNPEELSPDSEVGDFDDLIFETMREIQDGQMAELEARREAISGDLLLAILDAGPVTPADLAFLCRQQRKRALLSVDALIDLLDALDGDADLEPDAVEADADVEPSLGAPEREWWHSQASWASGNRADLEVVCEDEGADIQSQPHDDEPDREPSLGWSEAETLDQRWSWKSQFGDSEEDGWRRARRERIDRTEDPGAAAYRTRRDLARLMSGTWAPECGNLRPILLTID